MDLLIPEFDFTITFQSIVIAQLFGFTCWNLLMLFIKKRLAVVRVDSVIVVLTILLGALSLAVDVYTIVRDYFSTSEYNQYSTSGMTFNYWSYLLWKMIVTVLASQSLWFKHIRNARWLRFIVSLLIIFFLFFERIVILITNLHRDYLPSGWGMTKSLLATYIELFVVFLLLTAMGCLLRLYKLLNENGIVPTK